MTLFGNPPPLETGQLFETSHTDGTKTVTFQRGYVSTRLTYNEPSSVALENFRITLHEILNRIIDNTSPPPASNCSRRSSPLDCR